jgi:3-oxoacyl-[acyl-carrier protein] reductase
MMRTLDQKIALVTGGSRGIGRAIALRLGEAGAEVTIIDKVPVAESQKVAEDIVAKGGKANAMQCDAASLSEVKDVVDKVVGQSKRLDILVNNVGITRDGLLMRMSEEDWDLVIAVNLKSVFNFTKAVTGQMMSQRAGKIISIASIVGITGNGGQANYSASKAGIIGFTRSIAKELASRNIQVNAVAPGFVETAMTQALNEEQRQKLAERIPLKRTAKPEEIAGVVAFLASSDADYITGQVICVDGGMAMV